MLLLFLWLWPVAIFLASLLVVGLKANKTGRERVVNFLKIDLIASPIAYVLTYLTGSYVLSGIGGLFRFDIVEFFQAMPVPLLVLFLGGFFILYLGTLVGALITSR